MSVWLRRIVDRLVTPVDRPAPDDLAIIPGLFGPVPPAVTRELAAADRQTDAELRALDTLLGNWSGRPRKNWELVDAYLDERLAYRPADVMATGEPS